jgi:hypothetical protein
LDFHKSERAGDYNPIGAADDQSIIFSDGPAGSGNLVIAPWSAEIGGLKIFGTTGNVAIKNAVADEALHVGGRIKLSTLDPSTANAVVTHVGGVLQQRSINPRVWDTVSTFMSGSVTNNTILKGLGPNAAQNSNITDTGNTITIGGTILDLKPSTKLFDLYNVNNYFRFKHDVDGSLKLAYNNTTDLDINASSQYVYTPHSLLINTTTTGTYKLRVNGSSQFDGELNCRGNINVGILDNSPNFIAFAGTVGDNQGNGWNHTFIGERVYEANTEKSELFLFKGNDIETISGPDRIRMAAANLVFQTFQNSLPGTTSGTFEQVATSTTPVTRMRINTAGDVLMGNDNIQARYSDGKLLVGSSEVVTANTWASLAPANTPVQTLFSSRDDTFTVFGPSMIPILGSEWITSRKANSKFLLRATIYNNGLYFPSYGFQRWLSATNLTGAVFTRPINSAVVTVTFPSAHNIQVGDLIILDNVTLVGTQTQLDRTIFGGANSFRVESRTATNITYNALTPNTAAVRTSPATMSVWVTQVRNIGGVVGVTGNNNNGPLGGGSIFTGHIGQTTTNAEWMHNTTIETLFDPGPTPAGSGFYFYTAVVSRWAGVNYTIRINNRGGTSLDMRSKSSMVTTEITS